MGFDLNGENKKGEETYFRANVWTWRPLWKLVCIETNLSSEVYEEGSLNNGFLINKKMSKKIYNKLKNIDIDKEIKLYNEYLISLPLEDCNNCKGKGKKNKKDCVVCTNEYSKQDGIPIGKQKNFQTSYFLDMRAV